MTIVNNYGWKLTLTGNTELLTEETIEKLKTYSDTIYFNDTSARYWMFDFKIDGLWFETVHIDMCTEEMEINVFHI